MDIRLVVQVPPPGNVQIWTTAGSPGFYGWRIMRSGREMVSSDREFPTIEAAWSDAQSWLRDEIKSIALMWAVLIVAVLGIVGLLTALVWIITGVLMK